MMLSVILPTYNEAKNLSVLIPEIKKVLKGVPHEIIVVDDDSPDGTWKTAQDLNVLVKRRKNKRGLSSAVIEGFCMAKGEVFAVIDADFQHNPKLLLELYKVMSERGRGNISIAIASRYLKGGSVSDWRGYRKLGSKAMTVIARLFCSGNITDPLSGCFAIRRNIFESVRRQLQPRGFKILLEILANLPIDTCVDEVPLHFGLRSHGQSKLSINVQMEFAAQIFSLLFRTIRGRFVLFVLFLLCIVFTLVPRLWGFRFLYVSENFRSFVQSELKQVVEKQGWILSDVSLREATPVYLRFVYQSHIRGKDPSQCYIFYFEMSDIVPCEK